ncbi:MAG: tRNA (adenosine(37)-N6)-threonylcarbamoyltransferase complex ATPase subunit type 1 TsaE [Bacteroidota bacterium]
MTAKVNLNFTLAELPAIASKIIEDNPQSRIIAFYGKMGVGKTTLIKAICAHLKTTDVVGSPTFSIVNQYLTQDQDSLYHFDFYRLKKLEELYDLGYEDYFFSGDYCLLEWPEKVESLLPENTLRIYLEENDGLRNIQYTPNE